MPRSPKPRTLKKYGPRARKLFRTDDAIKALYKKKDELEAKLLAVVRAGDRIPIGPNKYAVLVDNFAEKNKAFRAHGISRFEFKVEVAEN